jgi:hypothetical protein
MRKIFLAGVKWAIGASLFRDTMALK